MQQRTSYFIAKKRRDFKEITPLFLLSVDGSLRSE
jgi:hypothetical protein